MKAITCDRCKKPIEDSRPTWLGWTNEKGKHFDIDLCQPCTKRWINLMERWLEGHAE